MKKCPKCDKEYMDYYHYCMQCNYRLIYIEGTERFEYCPEPTGSAFTNPSVNNVPIITCPYCKSTNTKKIGILGRSISFELFGFGSSKVGKQWHCNNCNSDF